MLHEETPALADLMGKRLVELLRARYLTQRAYREAVSHGMAAVDTVVQYLNACYALHPHERRDSHQP